MVQYLYANVLFMVTVLATLVIAQNKPDFNVTSLPNKWEDGQVGSNTCKQWGQSSSSSLCQNVFINNARDFCLWGPIQPNSAIGDVEASVVSYCVLSGYGTRLIPDSTITGVQFLKTPNFLQVTGTGDFTKINIKPKDEGGELDPHGADGLGNPKGGLVFSNNIPGQEGTYVQIKEWNNFMSAHHFSFRAAFGLNAAKYAPHIYDVMGALYNSNSGKFHKGVFEDCSGESGQYVGVYNNNSTFQQGQPKTPAPHKAAPSSACKTYSTISNRPISRRPYRRSVIQAR